MKKKNKKNKPRVNKEVIKVAERLLEDSPGVKNLPSLQPFIDNYLDFQLKSKKKVDYQKIIEFINLAKNDVALADHCFEKNDINNALFHLEQSIEKSVKAWAMHLRIIRFPRGEVGHQPLHAFTKLVEFPFVPDIVEEMNLDKSYEKKIKELKKSLKRDPSFLVKMDKDIPEYLKIYKKVVIDHKNRFESKDFNEALNTLISDGKLDLGALFKISDFFSYFLYPFGGITSIYAIDPRYEENPSYKNRKVVKHFNEISNIMKEGVRDLEDYINNVAPLN